MQTYPGEQGSIKSAFFTKMLTGTLLFITAPFCFAATVVINGNTTISTRTVYDNTVLDMTNGRFTLEQGGSLSISNSVINVTLSTVNPFFAVLNAGKLSMTNSTVHVVTSGLTPTPNIKPPYELIHVNKGNIKLSKNNFDINQAFTVGFLDTQDQATNDFSISENTIKNFHSGIYLINSDSPDVSDNTFENVSFANVFINGHLGAVERNTFTFPGGLRTGDAIDVINADGVLVADNIIASSSGYGIYILGGFNVILDNNKVTDGKSYAIYFDTATMTALKKHPFLPASMLKGKFAIHPNENITITNNYISLNRYGITGGAVQGLTVTDNTFIQRFPTAAMRQFWTNNDTLLPLVTDLNWSDNVYKEAFTQEVPGDNTKALQFVTFPAHGGVVLP